MHCSPPIEPILVVDDEPDVREGLTLLLQTCGYTVTAAADGQAALDELRGPSRPWLILLDLMMPIMDGFEFRVRQLQDPELAGLPVIVFSAGGDLDRKVASLGAATWLTKPVEATVLLDVIDGLAESRARRAGGDASDDAPNARGDRTPC
jgi:CheY-like chemotaxis protein